MSTRICWKAQCGFWKPLEERIWWPRACHHFNVALNERASTRRVTAQSAERRGVWSPCIRNEWKERKTTQQHGQIRLSETIFKIWVRVQAVTSPSLTTALHSLLCTPFLLHLIPLLLSLSFLLTHFTYPHLFYCVYFIHSFYLPPSFSSSFLSICRACAAWAVCRGCSFTVCLCCFSQTASSD